MRLESWAKVPSKCASWGEAVPKQQNAAISNHEKRREHRERWRYEPYLLFVRVEGARGLSGQWEIGFQSPVLSYVSKPARKNIQRRKKKNTRNLRFSFFSDGSYIIVLCSKLLRSNILTLPSAPQLTKTSTLFAQNRTSNTSLSWAISCVLAVSVGISQIVHVVSMLDVIIRLGETIFQSNEVIGAVCSGVFELERRARGDSFCTGLGLLRLMELLPWCCGAEDSDGKDHSRKWSPEVANRSEPCFWDEGGSHNIRVTG